ncbi:hypothetical protein L1887_53668 [Cichorium endivia]|nr:hypothetical protein L1887_53668 [Cichorium endivia]
MRDMHMQHRGSILGYDEGLASGDVRLAQAVWRNIWGAGWGTVAGVKRKLAGVDKLVDGEKDDPEGQPELARDAASLDPRIASRPNASAYARAASASLAADRANAQPSTLPPDAENPATMPAPGNILPALDPLAAAHPELAFPHHLHRIVTFIRAESSRLANLSDREIMFGMHALCPMNASAHPCLSCPHPRLCRVAGASRCAPCRSCAPSSLEAELDLCRSDVLLVVAAVKIRHRQIAPRRQQVRLTAASRPVTRARPTASGCNSVVLWMCRLCKVVCCLLMIRYPFFQPNGSCLISHVGLMPGCVS